MVHVKEMGTPVEAPAILSAGELWQGEGWTTGRASKALYQVAGVPLVSPEVKDYKGAFLYALALHWNLDIIKFELSEKAAEAAFSLAAVFSNEGQAQGDVHFDDRDGDNSDVEEELRFEWEERLTPLPSDLAHLWARYGDGSQRFDVKSLLEQMPKWEELPPKAPDNNLITKLEANSSLGRFDKLAKTQQTWLLHNLRVLAVVSSLLSDVSSEEPRGEKGQAAAGLVQRLWACGAAQYAKLAGERREACLPGSSASQDHLLFGAEEVKEFQAKKKLQDLRRGMSGAGSYAASPQCSFRHSTGSYNKPGGRGKGQGGRFIKGQGGRFGQGHGGRMQGHGGRFGTGQGGQWGNKGYTSGRGRGVPESGSPFPAHIHLRERLEQWQRMNASREVLLSISQGVLWDWQPPTFCPCTQL